MKTGLPIDDALPPPLLDALRTDRRAVLMAPPPGAGKTTVVPPLALLDAGGLCDGRILMLEPRRLAARAAAERMAESLAKPLGKPSVIAFAARPRCRNPPGSRW